MNPTHVHLLFNHFPIVGTLIGSLIMLYGILKKQDIGKTIGAVIIVAMSIIAIPVMLTGEPAEESVEHLKGISKDIIHDHEEAAEKAFWLMEASGIISLIALSLYRKKPALAAKAFSVAFAFSVFTFLTMAWAGNMGGKIRHPEISNSFLNAKKTD